MEDQQFTIKVSIVLIGGEAYKKGDTIFASAFDDADHIDWHKSAGTIEDFDSEVEPIEEAPKPDYSGFKLDELKQVATGMNVEFGSRVTKAELIALIEKAS